MPHLVIEYSADLGPVVDVAAVCRAAHEAMVRNPLFPVAGVRVRAYAADHHVMADGDARNAFMALTLSVGAGRSKADLKRAGDAIFAAVQQALAEPLSGQHFALSLYIQEMDPELSWKDNPIHARLRGATTKEGEGTA